MSLSSRAVALLNEQYRKVLQKMRGLEWLAQQIGPMLAGIRSQVSSLNPAGAGLRPGGRGLALASPISAELLESRQLLSAALVTDINVGGGSSDPANLTDVNGTLYFTANDGVHGTELWKSDGSATGTVLVKDISIGSSSSNPANLVNVNGRLYFTASDSIGGSGLWTSDGTASGTTFVHTVSSNPSYGWVAVGGNLYYLAKSQSSGWQLWRMDQTGSSEMAVGIGPDANDYSIPAVASTGSGLYVLSVNSGQVRLTTVDGGSVATQIIADTHDSSLGLGAAMTVWHGSLYFVLTSRSGVGGGTLWRTDGTLATTRSIASLNQGSCYAEGVRMGQYSDSLLISVYEDYSEEQRLWKTDGTPGGTSLLAVGFAWEGTVATDPGALNGVAYLVHATSYASELWQTDGTAGGTQRVAGAEVSNPSQLTVSGGHVFFAASDGTHGTELRAIRPPTAVAGNYTVAEGGAIQLNGSGTDPVAGETLSYAWDLDNDGTFETQGANPTFSAANLDGPSTYTVRLKVSNSAGLSAIDTGTVAITQSHLRLIKDINPGSGSSPGSSIASPFTAVSGVVYFAANDPTNGCELWKSDGTAAGTVLVKDINPGTSSSSPSNLTNVNGTLYFTAYDPTNGWELWRSDGTAAGTVLVKDINPGTSSSSPSNLTNVNGTLYFTASDGLWKSDGTTNGTVRVKSAATVLMNANGTLYFTVNDGTTGLELWKSNGTDAGTQRVAGIYSGSGYVFVNYPVNVDGVLYFQTYDPVHGSGLWKSDGTAAGTVLVRAGAIDDPVNLGGKLYFGTWGASGYELWKSDGTAAGTVLVMTLASNDWYGMGCGGTLSSTVVNGVVYLALYDSVGNYVYELWQSDGTAAGTSLIKVLDSSACSGAILAGPAYANGTVYFQAYDPAHGTELWGLRPPTAVAGNYTVAEGDTVRFNGSGTDPISGETLTYTWDLDGDGIYGETGANATHGDEVGAAPVFSAAGLDGPLTRTVRLKVTNSAGLSAIDTGVITIAEAVPVLVQSATASPTPNSGTATGLSVAASCSAGQEKLVYTWSVLSKPSGAADPVFSFSGSTANGTNAANSCSARFFVAGTYTFRVTIANGATSIYSDVTVQVQQAVTSIQILPVLGAVEAGANQQFTAAAFDQFGNTMIEQPAFTWSVPPGMGSITNGRYVAPLANPGIVTIRCAAGEVAATAIVRVPDRVGGQQIDLQSSSIHLSAGTGEQLFWNDDGSVKSGRNYQCIHGCTEHGDRTGDLHFLFDTPYQGLALGISGSLDSTKCTLLPSGKYLVGHVVVHLSDGSSITSDLTVDGTASPFVQWGGDSDDNVESAAQPRTQITLAGSISLDYANVVGLDIVDVQDWGFHGATSSDGPGGQAWCHGWYGLQDISYRLFRSLNSKDAVCFDNSGADEGKDAVVGFTALPAIAGGATFSFDLDGDDVFEILNSTSPYATVLGSHLEGPGTWVVKGRIHFADNTEAVYTTSIAVRSVAPIATLSLSATKVMSGDTITASLLGPWDPSSADTAAGFRYSFAKSADQLAATYESAGTANQQQLEFPQGGTYTVYARIFDRNGASRDYTASVQVVHRLPTGVLSLAGTKTTEGTGVTARFTATTPSSGLHYSFASSRAELATSYAAASSISEGVVTFNEEGTYVVYGRIIDDQGAYSDYELPIEVDNADPSVTLNTQISSSQPGVVTISGAVSDPGTADLLSITIDFGDGSAAWHRDNMKVGDTFSFDHYYRYSGDVTLIATVVDDDGGLSTTTKSLHLTGVAPHVIITGADTVDERSPITLSGQVDENSGPLTPPYSYQWAMTRNGVAVEMNGIVTTAASLTYTPPTDGSYEAVLTVTDAAGRVGWNRFAFTAVNIDAPVVVIEGPTTVDEGHNVTLTARAVEPAGSDANLVYTWQVDQEGKVVTTGAGRTLTFYAPQTGAYRVRLTAADPQGRAGQAVTTIIAQNVAPYDATITGVEYCVQGESAVFTAHASDPGLPADELSYSWSVSKYDLDALGQPKIGTDGKPIELSVTLPADAVTNLSTFLFQPETTGLYVVRVSVSDSDGGTTVAEHTLQAVTPNEAGFRALVSTHGFSRGSAAGAVEQADGKLLVFGQGSQTGGGYGLVTRFMPDGTPDMAFGQNGVAVITGPQQYDSCYPKYSSDCDLLTGAVRPNGKIICIGRHSIHSSNYGGYTFLVQLNADGTLDSGAAGDSTPLDSFGSGGMVFTRMPAVARNILVRADGRILIAGGLMGSGQCWWPLSTLHGYASSDSSHGFLMQFLSDGKTDEMFGIDGVLWDRDLSPGASQPTGWSGRFEGLTVGSDGRVYTTLEIHRGYAGAAPENTSTLFCLDSIGQVIWRQQVSGCLPTTDSLFYVAVGGQILNTNPAALLDSDGKVQKIFVAGQTATESTATTYKSALIIRAFGADGLPQSACDDIAWRPIVRDSLGNVMNLGREAVIPTRVYVDGSDPACPRLMVVGHLFEMPCSNENPYKQFDWDFLVAFRLGANGKYELDTSFGTSGSGYYVLQDVSSQSLVTGMGGASGYRGPFMLPAGTARGGLVLPGDEGQATVGTLLYRLPRNIGASDLTATATPQGTINLRWVDTGDTESGFIIERKSIGSDFVPIATVTDDVTIYEDKDVKPGTQYFYRVRAFDASGTQAISSAGTTLGAPTIAPVASATTAPANTSYVWQESIYFHYDVTQGAWVATSQLPLADGAQYQLRASGELFDIQTLRYVDAEYAGLVGQGTTGNSTLRDSSWAFLDETQGGYGVTGYQGHLDYGISVNDSSADANKYPYWGALNLETHSYVVQFVGNGKQLQLTYRSDLPLQVAAGVPTLRVDVYRAVITQVTQLTAVVDRPSKTVTLTWPAAPDAAGYEVYRKATGENAFTKISGSAPLSSTQLTYSEIIGFDIAYTYKVVPVSSVTATTASDEVTVTMVNLSPVCQVPELVIAKGSPLNYTLLASDPDSSQPLTYALEGAPVGLVVSSGGVLSGWTPAQTGTYTFALVLTDADARSGGHGGISRIPMTIRVIEGAPVISSIATPAYTDVTHTALSLQAQADNDASLSYQWSLVRGPAAVEFAAGGTKSATATLHAAGDYVFRVTVTRVADGLSTSRDVTMSVAQQAMSIQIRSLNGPGIPTTGTGGELQFMAQVMDQFGHALEIQPTTSWVFDSTPKTTNDGSPQTKPIGPDCSFILTAGTCESGSTPFPITVSACGLTATTSYCVVGNGPEFDGAPTIGDRSGTTYKLSIKAHNYGTDSTDGLGYIWTVDSKPAGAPDPVFSRNSSYDAATTQVTLKAFGSDICSYTFSVLVVDKNRIGARSDTVTVVLELPDADHIVITQSGSKLKAILVDQYGGTWSTQPSFTWTYLPGGMGGSLVADATSATATYVPSQLDSALAEGQYTDTIRVAAPGYATVQLDVLISKSMAPVARITSIPKSDSATKLEKDTDIAIVAVDANQDLQSYILKLVSSSGVETILTQGSSPLGSEPATGVKVATIRPAYIDNGLYTLVLEVKDGTGHCSTDTRSIEIHTDVKLGGFTFSASDLSVSWPGLPITISRSYDSLNANHIGDFGAGWRFDLYDVNLHTTASKRADSEYCSGSTPSFHAGDVVYFTINGQQHAFYFDPDPQMTNGQVNPFSQVWYPHFKPVNGETAQLELASGIASMTLSRTQTGEFYYIGGSSGTMTGFNPALAAFGGVYILKTADGSSYTISAATGKLQSIQTQQGATVTFSEGEIDGPSGQKIVITRTNGLITRLGLKTAAGTTVNTISYTYSGNLLQKVTLADGTSTTYLYDNAAYPTLISGIQNALGVRTLTVNYDASGRLQGLTDMYGKATTIGGGTVSGVTGQSVTDSTGSSAEVLSDDHGNPVRTITQVRDGQGKLTGYQVVVQRFAYGVGDLVYESRTSRTYFIAGGDEVGSRYTIAPADDNSSDWQSVTTYAIVHPTLNGEILAYPGEILTQRDASGRVVAYTYDFPYTDDGTTVTQGRPVLRQVTDAYGNTTTYTYYASTNPSTGWLKDSLASTTNALNEITYYSYTAGGSYTYSSGDSVDYAGLPSGLSLETWKQVNGQKIVLSRNYYFTSGDHIGELSKSVDVSGVTTEYVNSFTNGNTPNDTSDDRQIAEVRRWKNADGTQYVLESHTETDLLDRVRLTRDAKGNTTRTEYNALGQVSSTTDQYGQTTYYDYNAAGQVIRTRYPDGAQTCIVYDAQGRVEWSTDRYAAGTLPNATHTFYDSLGRVYRTERVANVRVQIEIDCDIPGNTTIQRSYLVSSDTVLSNTQTIYNDQGEVEKQIGADGQSTSSTSVDGPDQAKFGTTGYASLQITTDALGHITRIATDVYDPATKTWKHQTVSVDALGHKTTTDYDVLGRVIKVTYDDGSFTETLYGVNGQPVSRADITLPTSAEGWTGVPEGGQHVVKIEQRKSGDPLVVTHYLYDKAGNLTDVWLPAVDDDRTTAITLVRPHWHYTYDANGNQLSQTSPNGIQAIQTVNGQQVFVADPNYTTSFTYDEYGRRLSRTLPPVNGTPVTETWTYDDFGRTKTHTDFDGHVTLYVYDNDSGLLDAPSVRQGALIEERRFASVTAYNNGQGTPNETTRYSYDALGRQFTVFEYSGAYIPNTAVRTETTTYDSVTGSIASVASPEGTISYEYFTDTGRLKRTYTTDSDIRYTYDELGRLKTVSTYKLAGVIYATPLVTTYTYDAVGNLDTTTNDNGTTTTSDDLVHDYDYDDLNRLDFETVKTGGVTLETYDYVLLSNGQRDYVMEKDYNSAGQVIKTVKTAWSYDADGRLTGETRNEGNDNTRDSLDYSDTFAFDLAGNRTSKRHGWDANHDGKLDGSDQIDETIAYAYNERDQLTNENSNIDANDVSYGYDANGSQTLKDSSGPDTIYKWDLRGRMVAIDVGNDGTWDTTYGYDSDGVRVSETASGNTTWFLNDKQNQTGYAKAIEDRIDTTTDGKPDTAKTGYILGQQVIAQQDAGTTPVLHYMLLDGHGSTRVLVTVDHQNHLIVVEQRYDYDAYGKLLSVDAVSAKANWLFGGDGIYDPKSGWTYHLARWRDGFRFTSYDSFEADPSTPAELHKYVYCSRRVTGNWDPTGFSEGAISMTTTSTLSATIGSWLMPALSAAKAVAMGVAGAVKGYALVGAVIGGTALLIGAGVGIAYLGGTYGGLGGAYWDGYAGETRFTYSVADQQAIVHSQEVARQNQQSRPGKAGVALSRSQFLMVFSQAHNASAWSNWYVDGYSSTPTVPFSLVAWPAQFDEATMRAQKIFFNVTHLNVADAMVEGRKDWRVGESTDDYEVDGNMTYRELYLVHSNPSLEAKTEYYRDGVLITASQVFGGV